MRELRWEGRRRAGRFMIALACATGLGACMTHMGPQAVPGERFDYSEAIARSWNEQLLLNLVRLRYRDNPMFLDVGSVVSHYEFTGRLGGTVGLTPGKAGSTTLGLQPGIEYRDMPTVTYSLLQGEEFATRLLSPVRPSTLFLLSQSGWSIERLFRCCVQKVNNLKNAVAAAGPTPDYVPDYEKFGRMAHLLRVLQLDGLLEVDLDKDGETLLISVAQHEGGPGEPEAAEIRQMLDLDPAATTYRVTPALVRKGRDEIAVVGRSLLGVLFYLSQSVEPPARDETGGRVTVTKYPDGRRFDWGEVTGPLLRIHSSDSEPADAAVRVLYRGTRFYIADSDLNSKSTFSLLSYLFNLKAGSKGGREPLLTFPVQ
jgi:hypothetical protein